MPHVSIQKKGRGQATLQDGTLSDIYQFNFKICEKGHLNYSSSGPVSDDHCSICGAKFVTACPHCETPIAATFRSPVFVINRKPINIPRIPGACGKCGTVFPWTRNSTVHAEMSEAEAVSLLLRCCNRFHVVARQLRQRHDDRKTIDIDDEYDVQDLLHALLLVHFNDIRREEWTPSYAGASARVDFLIKTYKLVVEVKKTRKGLDSKAIGNQLIEDIARYKQSSDCNTIICLIYDPEERIANPRGLVSDLEGLDKDVTVKVVMSPER